MLLSRTTPCQTIDIWQPRWKDRVVMIAKYKVGQHNEIHFSKTPSMKGAYYLSGEKAKDYPVETNGKVDCYAVPLNELELLERE